MPRLVFVQRENGPERLICEAEFHFDEGPFAGLKLVGFSLWRCPESSESPIIVTLPSRSFGIGAERRYFDLLRSDDPKANKPLKSWIIEQYHHQREVA